MTALPPSPAPPVERDTVEPPVRGERILRRIETVFLRVEQALPSWMAQTGALANVALLTAVATGVALLLWYTPSVPDAHASVRAMEAEPFTAGLVRSVHRYSSDLTVLLATWHALRLFVARRFTGARWLAWVTGIALVGLLWFVGWLGYWLVWDEAARQVALGTARLVDGLPIFADPLSRSFLTDETLNSLLFFVVFFLHMLLPLAMGIALWLHIARVSRSRFLPSRRIALLAVAAMAILAVVLPAAAGDPARMAVLPSKMAVDAWFLLPVALTDRVGPGVLWAILLVGGPTLVAVPWWLGRGRARVALVDTGRCNGCTLCEKDCPYDAIRLVPRENGPVLATIDASKCVGCGVCAGACDSAAIALPWRPVLSVRKRVDTWLAAEKPWIAYVCAESAGAALPVDTATGRSTALPNWRVVDLPCSGWLHPLTVERALRHGSPGVLVVTCAECRFREGNHWIEQRVAQARKPMLRNGNDQVRVVALDRNRPGELLEAARAFEAGKPVVTRRSHAWTAVVAGVLLAGVAWAGSRVPYAPPAAGSPELVVSFLTPGKVGENCHKLTDAEKAALPAHMRRDQVCDRGRAPVRLRVLVDGEEKVAKSYPATGLWGDGHSVGVEHLPLPAGPHRVEVAIGDSANPDEWAYTDARTVDLVDGERRVVLFERTTGFTWK